MRVIVTRPEPECSQWVRAMLAHGLDATPMPLIVLGSANDEATVRGYWRRLAQYRAVMFVSGAAVQHFFSRCPAQEAPPIAGGVDCPRFWATGPGTVASLVRQGVESGPVSMRPMPTRANLTPRRCGRWFRRRRSAAGAS